MEGRVYAKVGAAVRVGNSNHQKTAAEAYVAAFIRECEEGSGPFCIMFTPRRFGRLPRLHVPQCADLSAMQCGVAYPMSPLGGEGGGDRIERYALRLRTEDGGDEYIRLTRRQIEDARTVYRMNRRDAPALAEEDGGAVREEGKEQKTDRGE